MRQGGTILAASLGLAFFAVVAGLSYWMLEATRDTGVPEAPLQTSVSPPKNTPIKPAPVEIPPATSSSESRPDAVADRPEDPVVREAAPQLQALPSLPRAEDVHLPAQSRPAEESSTTASTGTPDPPSPSPSFTTVRPIEGRIDAPTVAARGTADLQSEVEAGAPTSVEPSETQPARRQTERAEQNDAAVQVRLSTDRPAPAVGETIRIDILISGASDVVDVPFNLRYDPATLQYLTATEGTFLGSPGGPTVFLVRNDPARGVVYFGLSRSNRGQGASGTGVLASVEFQLKAPGGSTLEFFRQAVRNSQGNLLPASFIGSTIG